MKPQNKSTKTSLNKQGKQSNLKISPKSKNITVVNGSNTKKDILEKASGQKFVKMVQNSKQSNEISLKNNKKLENTKINFGLPAIKTNIPKAYPKEFTAHVSNLPKHLKQIEIIEAFNKFGSITYIQNLSKINAIIVAFAKEDEAQAAILNSNKVTIRGAKLKISKRDRKPKSSKQKIDSELFERTIFVFRVDPSVTEENIRNHFNNCGEIESVKCVDRGNKTYFVLVFSEVTSSQAALKLHNSILLESNINVRLKSNKPISWDLNRTVILLNPDSLSKLDPSIVTKVFGGCGDIEICDVLCSKQKLAIITFKSKESAQKALQLNGKTQNGLNIQLKLYSDEIKQNSIPAEVNNNFERFLVLKETKRKIVLKKVPKNTTKEQIQSFFEVCGPVKSVTILQHGAVVEFESVEGYCEAFTYYETPFNGQPMYIVPYSEVIPPSFVTETTKKAHKRANSNQNGPPVKK